MVWASDSPAFSIIDPRDLGFYDIDSPEASKPGRIL